MPQVNSSTIELIDYDPATQELTVAFRSGGTYAYSHVSPAVHAELMAAPSHGKYWNRHKAAFPFVRVG